MSSFQTYLDEDVTEVEAKEIQQRYSDERTKRLRDDAHNQFIDIATSEKFKHFMDDPWVEPDTVADIRDLLPTNRCENLIIGGGLGGILNAVHLIESGVRVEDIRVIDTAGGFGGTVSGTIVIERHIMLIFNSGTGIDILDSCAISRVIAICRC